MSVAGSWKPRSTANHTAQFGERCDPSAAVITAAGEFDAANCDELTALVQLAVSRYARVVLDLRGVKFIGTAGFSALHRINVVCSGAQAQWTMMPSAAVTRLLRICDPDGTLPVTTDEAESSLQLVSQSR